VAGNHVLAIDLGTSGPKVAVFTLDGDFVDGEFEPVPLRMLDAGGVEQRPSDWWDAIVAARSRLAARASVRPDGIAAVSVTSQWSGTVPIDKDGTPLHDALIWMDSRGAPNIERIVGGPVRVAGYDPRKLRTWIKLTGGIPAHSGKDPTAHILWLQEHRPEVARATWKYLEPKDWLNLKLTGRCAATFDSIVVHWVTDNRDPHRIDYAPDLLRLSGLDRAQLPDLVPASSVIGELTDGAASALQLPAGVPVTGGTPDVQSAALGSGAVRDYDGHLYIGTSSWITCHVPLKKTDVLRGVASLPSPLPGKYFVANEQESAGVCLTWLRDNVLGPHESYAAVDLLAATAPAGSNGLLFTPWLNGERTPVDDHTVRGGWHNVSLQSTRADLTRSVLEGVAYNSRWLLECVEKFTDRPFPWLNFIGGGAQSELWAQIFADVLDRTIRVVAHPIHANARGAALLGSLALGARTVDDIARTVTITKTYEPDRATRGTYDPLYREFRNIYKANKRMYARLNGGGER
jgi:xylulokinase